MAAGPRSAEMVRVAAVADVHCSHNCPGTLLPLFNQIAQAADVLALCGDLTDYGHPDEAQALIKELSSIKLPTVAVLGNHDYESDKAAEIRAIFTDAGITTLDGEVTEIHGVGFAGVKGFCGGFGRGTLSAWGEPVIKEFVKEAINEAVKLETALTRLDTRHKIVLMHYAPIRATIEGEPLEIFPFLGCSRLEEPLNRFEVTAVVHGHAHGGAPEGETSTGVPVYNVSLPVMKKHFPDRPPFRVINVPVERASGAVTRAPLTTESTAPPVETRVSS
jgi:Icc-related predicted phosphoesterase